MPLGIFGMKAFGLAMKINLLLVEQRFGRVEPVGALVELRSALCELVGSRAARGLCRKTGRLGVESCLPAVEFLFAIGAPGMQLLELSLAGGKRRVLQPILLFVFVGHHFGQRPDVADFHQLGRQYGLACFQRQFAAAQFLFGAGSQGLDCGFGIGQIGRAWSSSAPTAIDFAADIIQLMLTLAEPQSRAAELRFHRGGPGAQLGFAMIDARLLAAQMSCQLRRLCPHLLDDQHRRVGALFFREIPGRGPSGERKLVRSCRAYGFGGNRRSTGRAGHVRRIDPGVCRHQRCRSIAELREIVVEVAVVELIIE